MFFSTYILSRKGPFAKVWLAAHWEKKLTRNDIRLINLSDTVVNLVHPVVPIALRTSGELLVGIVRIYALKVKYLLRDAHEATLQLRTHDAHVVTSKDGKSVAVVVDVALTRGGGQQALDADFTEVADILGDGAAAGASTVGHVWFTAEPSQFLDDTAPSQIHDELARLRADLNAFEHRAESSNSKKSSLSSAERARASGGAAAAAVDGVYLLDANVPPPPDDVAFPPLPDDPLAALDPMQLPPDGAGPAAVARAKRLAKMISLIDVRDTVLSKAELDRTLRDTRDVTCAERRHGPLDEAECFDRHAIRRVEGDPAHPAPLTPIDNVALRMSFEAMARSRLEAAKPTPEAAKHGHPPAAAAAAPHDVDMPPLPEEEALPPPSSRKRARDADGAGARDEGLSASARRTWSALRDVLKSKTSRAAVAAAAPSSARVDIATTFVDTLVLASHGVVVLRQERPYGPIDIARGDKFSAAPHEV